MARVTLKGTCVAARPGRDNQDGSPSKYLDVKVLVGETVVKAWAFADQFVEKQGGALPEVGSDIAVTAYVQAKLPKDGGQPYLAFKAVEYETLTQPAAVPSSRPKPAAVPA